jgi:hypothetical protein
MQQLEINAKEMDSISEELQSIEENIENDYDTFTQGLNSKRRQEQEQNAKEILKNAKTVEEARRIAIEKEKQAAAVAAANASEPQKVINNILNKINTKVAQLPIQPVLNKSAPQPLSMSVTIDPNTAKNIKNTKNKVDDFSSVILGNDDELNKFLDDSFKSNVNSSNQSTSINDNLSSSKLNDKLNNKTNNNLNYENDNDDDDDENDENESANQNPMVAAFKETIDSTDEESEIVCKRKQSLTNNNINNNRNKQFLEKFRC